MMNDRIKKRLKTALKVMLPLSLGLLLLWLLYRNMDIEALLDTLKTDANFWVIAMASLFGTLGNTFRGWRWQILNKKLDPEVSTLTSILTIHGNYMVNMALPRLGEVWRCAAMSKYSNIGFSKLFGTLLVDRAFDVVAIVALLMIGMVLNLGFFGNFFAENPDFVLGLQRLFSSTWFYVILIGLIVVSVFLYYGMRNTRAWEKLKSTLMSVLEGWKTVNTMDQKWLFHLLTVAIWGSYFLQFYLTFFAFSFTKDLTVAEGLLTFVMCSIGVLAPVQAGIGAWHFMVIYSFVAFGIAEADAQNFALIVHAFQGIIWTTVVGLVSIALLPVVNRDFKKKEVTSQVDSNEKLK